MKPLRLLSKSKGVIHKQNARPYSYRLWRGCEKFHLYLYGTTFDIYADHNPSKLSTTRNLNPQHVLNGRAFAYYIRECIMNNNWPEVDTTRPYYGNRHELKIIDGIIFCGSRIYSYQFLSENKL